MKKNTKSSLRMVVGRRENKLRKMRWKLEEVKA